LKRVGTPFLREYPIYVKKEVERLKQEMEKANSQIVKDVEVNGETLDIITEEPPKPKIKRTRKKKEENGTE
jgi:hypothetical protein